MSFLKALELEGREPPTPKALSGLLNVFSGLSQREGLQGLKLKVMNAVSFAHAFWEYYIFQILSDGRRNCRSI